MRAIARLLLALPTAAVLTAAGAAQTSPKLPEAFTANAINMSNIGSTVPVRVDVTITGWTNAAEQERYISTLRSRGGEALAEALRNGRSIGTFRTPGNLAYDFRYAVQERTRDNLRRIILLTDRPIEGAELYDRSRTLEYPFSAIELLVDDTGRGKGNLWIAAKLTLLDDLLIVDNYADRPVTLSDVRRAETRTP